MMILIMMMIIMMMVIMMMIMKMIMMMIMLRIIMIMMMTRELMALKRVSGVRGEVSHGLVLSPEEAGQLPLSLYIMSDCYLGLDQQYTLPLLVEESQGHEVFISDEE